mmetsp:Transcript_4589/g.10074  ORF Transcript_4589/g.10074 Transcript_4589/m.10074 type:complete len:111 (+) Transcript_4589:869-1201(+)
MMSNGVHYYSPDEPIRGNFRIQTHDDIPPVLFSPAQSIGAAETMVMQQQHQSARQLVPSASLLTTPSHQANRALYFLLVEQSCITGSVGVRARVGIPRHSCSPLSSKTSQ